LIRVNTNDQVPLELPLVGISLMSSTDLQLRIVHSINGDFNAVVMQVLKNNHSLGKCYGSVWRVDHESKRGVDLASV
jgi:hypothetical protein